MNTVPREVVSRGVSRGVFLVLVHNLLHSDISYTSEKPKPVIPLYSMEAMWDLHKEGKWITNPRLVELTERSDTHTRNITNKAVRAGIVKKTEDSIRGHITKYFLTQYGKNYIREYLGSYTNEASGANE